MKTFNKDLAPSRSTKTSINVFWANAHKVLSQGNVNHFLPCKKVLIYPILSISVHFRYDFIGNNNTLETNATLGEIKQFLSNELGVIDLPVSYDSDTLMFPQR